MVGAHPRMRAPVAYPTANKGWQHPAERAEPREIPEANARAALSGGKACHRRLTKNEKQRRETRKCVLRTEYRRLDR